MTFDFSGVATTSYAEFPPSFTGSVSYTVAQGYVFTDKVIRATVVLTNAARVLVATNADIGDLSISANSTLTLTNATLTVHAAQHPLSGTVVSNYNGVLVWQPLQISIANSGVLEGPSSSTTQAVFAVTISSPLDSDLTFAYCTSNGTAVAPGDYTAVTNVTAIVPAGLTQTNVAITVIGDDLIEPNETFYVFITN